MSVDVYSIASELRELVNEYYENNISFHEYRKRRSVLLRKVDDESTDVTSGNRIIRGIMSIFKKDEEIEA